MKWYLGKTPIFKLGNIICWKGVKYKVTNNKKYDKSPTTIGVKVVDKDSSNS